MTVRDLINQLNILDKDAEITIMNNGGDLRFDKMNVIEAMEVNRPQTAEKYVVILADGI